MNILSLFTHSHSKTHTLLWKGNIHTALFLSNCAPSKCFLPTLLLLNHISVQFLEIGVSILSSTIRICKLFFMFSVAFFTVVSYATENVQKLEISKSNSFLYRVLGGKHITLVLILHKYVMQISQKFY